MQIEWGSVKVQIELTRREIEQLCSALADSVEDCGGSVSSDRFFGFLGEEIVQLVVVVAVEM
jgi:hypothetical protein